MSYSLESRVILITGASRGIGRHVAIECARLGAHVHVCARSADALEEWDEHAQVTAHTCDVRDVRQLDALFSSIERMHGRLDVLVNNASILGPIGPLEEIEDEAWRTALDINLNGTFFVTRRALPLLELAERVPALIINLSSSVGRKARKHWGAYSISKIAVEGLTDLIADEFDASSLVAISLNPGGTATHMRAEAYPEEDPETLPSPAQVAHTITLLMQHIGSAQAGAKFSSRALFDLLDHEDVRVEDLPRDA